MKILSYNINGLNAFCKPSKDCDEFFKESIAQNDSKLCNLKIDFDNYNVYCFQEVKLNDFDKIYEKLYQWPNYKSWAAINDSKKGYAGVLTWMDNIHFRHDQFKDDKHYLIDTIEKDFSFNGDNTYTEGRVIISEFNDFYLLNVYVPNSGNKQELRKDWDFQFKNYIKSLSKPVIICGDMNVCSTYLDYWGNYEKAINTAPGLMDFEINDFNNLLNECNLIDVYRYLHPNERKYSWYSTRNKTALENNKGWRLDYFLVSKELLNSVKLCDVMQGYQSPDHSPIILEIFD